MKAVLLIFDWEALLDIGNRGGRGGGNWGLVPLNFWGNVECHILSIVDVVKTYYFIYITTIIHNIQDPE